MPLPALKGLRVGSETGQPDQDWINRVRDALQDYPQGFNDQFSGDGVNGAFGAGGTPIKASKPKIYDGLLPNGNPAISVTVGGVAQPVVTVFPPGAGNVYVNYNTGEITFGTIPPVGTNNVLIGFQWTRWSDQTILEALYSGLREMFPRVGKIYTDTTLGIRVNQWDYQLPAWAQDPRAKVWKIEVQSAAVTTEPFKELRVWNRVGLDMVHIAGSQAYSPTAVLRVTGWGPYVSLGDLEPQLSTLPEYYAIAVLAAGREMQDMRRDNATPQSQEGAHPVLQYLQIGRHYRNLFDAAMENLKNQVKGGRRRILTSYELNDHGNYG